MDGLAEVVLSSSQSNDENNVFVFLESCSTQSLPSPSRNRSLCHRPEVAGGQHHHLGMSSRNIIYAKDKFEVVKGLGYN